MSEEAVERKDEVAGRNLDAVIEALKEENEKFRHQLYSAREKAAKWKRRYYEEKNKK